MSRIENAMKQWFQVGQELLAGSLDVSATDIDRFRRRVHGPEGHPLLVRSERLPPEGRLLDLHALPDGSVCLLFRIQDPLDALLAVHGEHRFTLRPVEGAVIGKSRIIGMNALDAPIVEMAWSPTEEPGADGSMVYIGGKPLRETLTNVFQREFQAWTLGEDGRLYCVHRVFGKDDVLRLTGHDPLTGTRVHTGEPFTRRGDVIDALVVIDTSEYAFLSGEYDRMKKLKCTRVAGGSHLPTLVAPQGSTLVRRDGRLYLGQAVAGHEPHHVLSNVMTDDSARKTAPRELRGPAAFEAGLDLYLCALPHEQVGWIANAEIQPGFERVSDLFSQQERLRYWAQSGPFLYLMELPLPKR